MKNVTLSDLVRQFDETEDSKKKLALADQMEPLLGPAREEFLSCFHGLVDTKHPTPAQETLARMGFVALRKGENRGTLPGPGCARFVEQVEISCPSGAEVTSLLYGAWNLLPQGLGQSGKIPVKRMGAPDASTSWAIRAKREGMARIQVVFGEAPAGEAA